MPDPRRILVIGASLFLAAWLPSDAPLDAQEVRGTVVEEGTGSPIPAAMVRAVDEAGEERATTLSNESGRFVLDLPRAGTYRVRVERIGFESWTSPALEVPEDEVVTRGFEVPVRPVALGELEIGVERLCRTEPDEGDLLTALWEEARTALSAARLAERPGVLSLEMRRYHRTLAPGSLRVLDEESWNWTDTDYRAFYSLPAEELSEGGYVREDGDVLDYYAPDARALLSEEFARDHCFHVDESRRDEGLLGLGFEPVGGRRVPDIEGVMWLDAGSGALESLDFRYTALPLPREAPRQAREVASGRIEFSRLPGGHWFVSRWWIQMPVLGVVGEEERGVIPDAFRRRAAPPTIEVIAYAREGGDVVSVTSPEGEEMPLAEWGDVEGVVRDGLHGDPLADARVRLEGTGWSAEADGEGRFRLGPLPPGQYDVSVDHPLARLLPLDPAETIRVPPGETARVELSTGEASEILERMCPETGEASHDFRTGRDREKRAALVGFVRDPETSAPLAGADVQVDVSAAPREERTRSVTTDRSGAYVLCDLPGGEAVEVRVEAEDVSGSAVGSETPAYGLLWLDLEAPAGLEVEDTPEPEPADEQQDLSEVLPFPVERAYPLSRREAFWLKPAEESEVESPEGQGSALPCQVPLAWRVGEIDPRWGLDREDVLASARRAAGIWEEAADRPLFHRDSVDGFPIHLEYDERKVRFQQRAHALNTLRAASEATYDRLLQIDEVVQAANRDREVLRDRLAAIEGLKRNLEREEESLRDAIQHHDPTSRRSPGLVGHYSEEVTTWEDRVVSVEERSITVYTAADRSVLTNVIAHEFGHALGLGHVEDPGSVMAGAREIWGAGDELVVRPADRRELSRRCPDLMEGP